MDNEQTQFQNMDSWSGGGEKFGLTFKQIILMHLNRCVLHGSVEWHGGYWNTTGNNPTTRIYVPNSREVYLNSVRMLRACLLGYYDKKMEEKDKKLQKEFEEEESEYDKKENSDRNDYLWRLYKTEWHIELFEELIMLSKRLNFFEEGTSEEKM